MTVFLDYHLEGKRIITLSILDESNNIKTYTEAALPKVTEEIAGIELVVVFERPIINLYKAMEGYEHYLDDNELRKRWLDLHTIVRKKTGKTIALSKIAKSTLGLGPQSKINRLDKQVGPRDPVEIETKMTERLEILKKVFDYVIQFDQLSFEKHDETIWVELTIDENPVHGSI